MTASKALNIIGSVGAHDTLREVLANREACKVLDIPSGEGPLSQFLLDLGWEVHCADIDPGLLKVKNVPFTTVNMNRQLPIKDNCFDAIVCANALHRLYNPGGALREFMRILRPGGQLYINVNNYASIDRRLWFFLFGGMDHGINLGKTIQTIDDPEANVRVLFLFPSMANLLAAAGFELIDVKAADVRLRHRIMAPLAWLIRPAKYLLSAERRKRDSMDYTNSKAVFPGGAYLFVEARKPESQSEASGAKIARSSASV